MITNPYTFFIKTAVGSDVPIQLHPTHDFMQQEGIRNNFSRTIGGQLNAYSLVSSFESFSLPFAEIGSEDAGTIVGWWKANTLVDFTMNASLSAASVGEGWFIVDDAIYGLLDQAYNPLLGSGAERSITCRISNRQQPFSRNVAGEFTKLTGAINLVTVG